MLVPIPSAIRRDCSAELFAAFHLQKASLTNKKITALRYIFCCLFLVAFLFFALFVQGQQITGVWKGKINRQKVEVKIIQKGDSLTGTSYYYDSPQRYRRYSIRGYFDANTNEAVWWDDQLLEQKLGRIGAGVPGKIPLLSRADFNCPGSGRMMLDGRSAPVTEGADTDGIVDLDKTDRIQFNDEWDFVIDNYMAGANDPFIIDSIGTIALQKPAIPVIEKIKEPGEDKPIVAIKSPAKPKEEPVTLQPEKPKSIPVVSTPPPQKPAPVIVPPPTIEEKFTARKKVLVTEIPVTGDSIELRFYDNAEIDGDSITLFLNNKLIFEHIRLLGVAYTIKLAVADLQPTNELIMVAENLGSIPPNTSFMVAVVGDKRYEARLESTEGSSAMVKFIKQKE